MLDFDDPGQFAHVTSLLKRLDGEQGLRHLGPLPVRDELAPAEARPFADQTLGHAGQRAVNDGPVLDAHLGFVPAVDGVEVRRIVVPPLHVDHDAVELGQPRHDRLSTQHM